MTEPIKTEPPVEETKVEVTPLPKTEPTTPVVPVVTKPVVTPVPTPKPVVVVTKPLTREQTICARLGEIITEHGGLESNIPAIKNEYWILKAELNALRATP